MKTCLIVDDSAFERKLMAHCLQKLGFRGDLAASAREALSYCARALPDFILLDWEMPEMTGIELLKTLRKLPGSEHVVIILCTSNDSSSHIGHAYAYGANDYLIKPVTQNQLQQKLEECQLFPDKSA